MKKLFAIKLICFLTGIASLSAINVEVSGAYDYFRGIPDGSWNGNQGGVVGVNAGMDLYGCLFGQLGASYGLYNWDGRQNLAFENPKALEQQAFLTAGISTSYSRWNFGVVYDCQYVKHYSVFDVSGTLGQMRFQGGYQLCDDEVGIWGTAHLGKEEKHIDGVSVSYRAVSQLSGYWTHYFENCAQSTLWVGAPYQDSLRFSNKTAGLFVAGFAIKAPLGSRLFVEGHGSYMRARESSGINQSRNYAANISLGITYTFGECCRSTTYMPLANNSVFLVDTSANQ